ncbi:unnamed protein product [Pleuronectes platessa]|uniref:Uncharacterized protein n=1 Tax=Pleuronectes platessa TaxID=8262 RepID=A0A9N7V940_PLEPL|nr:unnamed protein product [Pleuronectes platessa]
MLLLQSASCHLPAPPCRPRRLWDPEDGYLAAGARRRSAVSSSSREDRSIGDVHQRPTVQLFYSICTDSHELLNLSVHGDPAWTVSVQLDSLLRAPAGASVAPPLRPLDQEVDRQLPSFIVSGGADRDASKPPPDTESAVKENGLLCLQQLLLIPAPSRTETTALKRKQKHHETNQSPEAEMEEGRRGRRGRRREEKGGGGREGGGGGVGGRRMPAL